MQVDRGLIIHCIHRTVPREVTYYDPWVKGRGTIFVRDETFIFVHFLP